MLARWPCRRSTARSGSRWRALLHPDLRDHLARRLHPRQRDPSPGLERRGVGIDPIGGLEVVQHRRLRRQRHRVDRLEQQQIRRRRSGRHRRHVLEHVLIREHARPRRPADPTPTGPALASPAAPSPARTQPPPATGAEEGRSRGRARTPVSRSSRTLRTTSDSHRASHPWHAWSPMPCGTAGSGRHDEERKPLHRTVGAADEVGDDLGGHADQGEPAAGCAEPPTRKSPGIGEALAGRRKAARGPLLGVP